MNRVSFFKKLKEQRGQSLFEVLIAITFMALVLGSTGVAIITTMKSNAENSELQRGYTLAKDLLDNTKSYAEGAWSTFYNKSTGASTTYYLSITASSATSSVLGISNGTTTFVEGTTTYTLWFSIEDVERNSSGAIATSGVTIVDPLTRKVTAYVNWRTAADTKAVQVSQFLANTRSDAFLQSDWSGASGTASVFEYTTTDYYGTSGTIINNGTSLTL